MKRRLAAGLILAAALIAARACLDERNVGPLYAFEAVMQILAARTEAQAAIDRQAAQ